PTRSRLQRRSCPPESFLRSPRIPPGDPRRAPPDACRSDRRTDPWARPRNGGLHPFRAGDRSEADGPRACARQTGGRHPGQRFLPAPGWPRDVAWPDRKRGDAQAWSEKTGDWGKGKEGGKEVRRSGRTRRTSRTRRTNLQLRMTNPILNFPPSVWEIWLHAPWV